MNTGERIKEIRLSLKLTQQEMANELEISREFLGLIERNEKDVSNSVVRALLDLLGEKQVPLTFLESYKEGKNFTKIIETLRKQGITLSQLRDIDFEVKGSELSSMYIGLKPIPSFIKKKLEKIYHVNPLFFKYGKRVPMFLNNKDFNNETIEIPFLKELTIQQSIDRITQNDFEESISYITFPTNETNAEYFVPIFGDNILPTFSGREIIGIKKTPIKNINYGQLYLLHLENGECLLRRVFQDNNSQKIILKKEDPRFPEVYSDIKSIKNIFVINTVINTQFH